MPCMWTSSHTNTLPWHYLHMAYGKSHMLEETCRLQCASSFVRRRKHQIQSFLEARGNHIWFDAKTLLKAWLPEVSVCTVTVWRQLLHCKRLAASPATLIIEPNRRMSFMSVRLTMPNAIWQNEIQTCPRITPAFQLRCPKVRPFTKTHDSHDTSNW